MRFVIPVLVGILIGCVVSMAYQCAKSWYSGGSPDPRCVYGWYGYVEVHVLGKTGELDRITCQYRPGAHP